MQRKAPLKRRKPFLVKRWVRRSFKRSKPRKSLKMAQNGPSMKMLMRQAELAMIEAVKRRDTHCQTQDLCFRFGGCNKVLQVDHSIVSRAHKSTFFDVRQMTLLCQSAHFRKTWNIYGFQKVVYDIVERREGKDYIEEVVERSRTIKHWRRDELERLITELNGMWA